MSDLGLEVTTYEPEPGRVNVVGRLKGEGGGRSLMLNGHTDTVGTPENNQALSQKRAESVKVYWTGKGVAASGLVAVGYGESKPLEVTPDETANEKNRRIEFTVTNAAAAVPAPAAVEPAK
ncbi:MAG: OmpA family protein [Hyphomonadaceae bacterium]|nr:OmpA family protein [Hyphomonadaceae bacterium]